MRAALAIAGLAVLWPAAAAAQRIERYEETVVLDAAGHGQVTLVVEVTGAAGTVRLPAPWGEGRALTVLAPDGGSARFDVANGWHGLAIDAATATDPLVVEITYEVAGALDLARAPLARNNRPLRYAFVHTGAWPIARFTHTVVLPPTFVVSNVDEVVPAATETTVDAPYALGRRDGRTTLSVNVAPLAVGGTVSYSARVRPAPSRTLLLLTLVALGGLYLHRFRDLRRPPPPAPGA